jgi:hypothetical protein
VQLVELEAEQDGAISPFLEQKPLVAVALVVAGRGLVFLLLYLFVMVA